MYKGERFNSITHLVGAVLAFAGGAVLVTFAAMDGDSNKIVSYSIYGATLFLLYLVSSLYHSLPGPAKSVFRVLDYQAIYLLIAGTYTPFIGKHGTRIRRLQQKPESSCSRLIDTSSPP